jgi:preprotein translocase subunit SecE
MAETDNPVAPISPRTARFGEGPEGKTARRERNAPHAGPGGPGRLAQFLRDVRIEMKRTTWPGVTEVKNTTIITLIAVIFFAIYLFAVDQGLSRLVVGLDWLMEKVIKLLGLG